MPSGKVKWFNNSKGFGFVLSDENDEDLFVHHTSIIMEGYRTLKAGQSVEFDTKPAEQGTHAINVRLADVQIETQSFSSDLDPEKSSKPE